MSDMERSPRAHVASDRAAIPMALALWVLVISALAYGVVQTLLKVVKLFS